jgi:hypothetical protein
LNDSSYYIMLYVQPNTYYSSIYISSVNLSITSKNWKITMQPTVIPNECTLESRCCLFWRIDCINNEKDVNPQCEIDIIYTFNNQLNNASRHHHHHHEYTQKTIVPLNFVNHKQEIVSTLDVNMPSYGICGSNVIFKVTLRQQTSSLDSIIECTAELSDWMIIGKSSRRVVSFVNGGPTVVYFELMPLRVGHLKVPLFSQRDAKKDSKMMACSREVIITIAPSGHFSTSAAVIELE